MRNVLDNISNYLKYNNNNIFELVTMLFLAAPRSGRREDFQMA